MSANFLSRRSSIGSVWIFTGLISLAGLLTIKILFPEVTNSTLLTAASGALNTNKFLTIAFGAAIESTYLVGTYLAGSMLILLALANTQTLFEMLKLYLFCNVGILAGLIVSCLAGLVGRRQSGNVPAWPNIIYSLHPNLMAVYCFSEARAGGYFLRVLGKAFIYMAASSLIILYALSFVATLAVNTAVENPFLVPVAMICWGCFLKFHGRSNL